ncbi:lysophospholipase [Dictyobacter vulcani]|uniref:Lysophospholipase n=1 Tax=Dictyobacter vulcani TaxID=2607529 RepID=A0A5J4L099_9CHLR|nr:alpha/beta fold hydrolase [Dictyobacter vulcani]GER92191.1 lysophospholipase [Dictyobacter vulcani]
MKRYNTENPGVWGDISKSEQGTYQEEYVTLPDDCKLFLRSWRRESGDVLLILHGLGGHGGWYVDMANELFLRGLNVYTVDHRGFGNSHGDPGHIDIYQQYVRDIAQIIDEIQKRHPDAHVYLLGHSMGGIFATHVTADYGSLLRGVIFLNPWIQDTSRLPLKTTFSILVGGLFKSRRLWRVGGGHEGMTMNKDAAHMLDEDPYWVRDLSATFLVQILRMRLATIKKARQVSIPALVVQAEGDKVVVPAATRKFYEALKSADKEWKTYPNWYHDTEFEDDRSALDDDIVKWIEAHR